MDTRTNIVRNNTQGFGYSFTATVDIQKRNLNLTPEAIQHHFDVIVGMALVDLISPNCPATIAINKNMLDLKYTLLPGYRELLEAVLITGENTGKTKNRRTISALKKDSIQNKSLEQKLYHIKELRKFLLSAIENFQRETDMSQAEIYCALSTITNQFKPTKSFKK